jgi:two-component system chemotaxis response regulator CheY
MRILVVDDSRMARSVIRKVLGELGYSFVSEAADGVEAMEKLRHSTFDLVMTDWEMPRMDGIELVREIRRSPDLDVPVLMVSGEGYAARFIEVLRAGAQGYIRKPFKSDKLQRKIDEVLKKQAMQTESLTTMLNGSLEEVGFPELVQFLASCAMTGQLVVDHPESGIPHRGTLHVHEGNVVAAFCGAVAGDEAVYAMAEWECGEFRFQPETVSVGTNTTMATLPLLMEAMTRRDERARTA